MIPIKPTFLQYQSCPSCGQTEVPSNDYIFQGMYILGVFTCTACSFEFLHTVPVGHAQHFPVAVSQADKRVVNLSSANRWFALPLQHSFLSENKRNSKFQVNRLKETNGEAIVLNCLDSCFGHIFAKVWNAQTLAARHPQKTIIVIIPLQYVWMVPEEVSEIWLVDIPISSANSLMEGFDAWVKGQFERFDKVWLSSALFTWTTMRMSMWKSFWVRSVLIFNTFRSCHFGLHL
jgi:hypothetical protein